MIRISGAAFAIAALLMLGTLSRAVAEDIPASLRACADEKSDAERLKCFDRELARIPAAQSAQEPAVAPAMTPEERFGRVGPLSREEGKREEKARGPGIKELTATVVSLSSRSYGELVMTLDNGQVWAQPSVDTHFSIKPQDKITIKAGALSSFTATSPSGRTTKVVRLR